jgi:hypothetical protein
MSVDSKVRQLPLVNKAWNRACQSPASWHSIRTSYLLDILIDGVASNSDVIMRLLPRLSRLEVLWCCGQTLRDAALSSVLEVCGPRLRELWMELTDVQLLRVAMAAPSLRFVYICDVSSAHGLASALPFLRQLRRIEMYNAQAAGVLYDISSSCPLLETYQGFVDEQLLTALAACEHLTELDVFCDYRVALTDAMAGFLKSVGHNLLSLDVPNCDGAVVLPLIAQYCKKLQTLSVSQAAPVTDVLMEELLAGCGSTLVRMSMESGCTDASFVSIATHCPNITDLRLDSNTHMTEHGVAALTTSCPNLGRLAIGLTYLSGLSLLRLAEHPALRYLHSYSDWAMDEDVAVPQVRIAHMATKEDVAVVHARRAHLGLRPLTITSNGPP